MILLWFSYMHYKLFKLKQANGNWGHWSGYSSCSQSCGVPGLQERSRVCIGAHNGGMCPGASKQTRPCDQGACPGEPNVIKENIADKGDYQKGKNCKTTKSDFIYYVASVMVTSL